MKRFRPVFCFLLLLVFAVQIMWYITMDSSPQIVADIQTAINRDSLGRSHPILTYFKRKNDDGSFKDISDTSNDPKMPEGLYIDRSVNTSVRIRVSPEIVSNGDTVGVAWYGVTSPTKDDWIGFYCPRGAKVSHFLDFYNVKEIPSSYRTNGRFKVQVYNLRSTCEFRYYSINKEDLILVARSNELKFASGLEEALYGHLALTGHDGEMRIMWVSGHDTTPVVRYGYTNDILRFKASGTSRTYTANQMCGPPAAAPENFVTPGFYHDVLLSKLKHSTRYYYQFGAGSGWSKIFSFETPPLIGNKDPFKFITYGDMGLYSPAPKVASLAAKEAENGARFVLHQGDLAYAGGYAYLWDQWLSMIEPIATRVPYMVGIGNHEQSHLIGGGKDPSKAEGNGFHPSWGNYLDDSGGECGVPVHYRFHMPDGGNSVWWYSFDYGMVHFVMMSTEHNFTVGSRQYQWLENDLASVNRNVTPWIILAGHRPMYCSIDVPSDYQVSLYIQQALEELFHKYKVNLGLYGHYHSYERTCQVYKHKCSKDKGMVHIVVGTAGASVDGYPSRSVGWSEYCNTQIIGYGRVTVVNDKELLWEFISADDGNVMDKTTIKR